MSKGRCRKGVKDFFCFDIPRGGREIVSGKRLVSGKRKDKGKKRENDGTVSVKYPSKELFCVARINYF